MSTVVASEITDLFDPLMTNIKGKLDVVFAENRLKGIDAVAVYNAALATTLHEVVLLLLGADQRATLAAGVLKINAETAIETAKLPNIYKEGKVLDGQYSKLLADYALAVQEKNNLIAVSLNIPKEGEKLDAETANVTGKTSLIPKESELMDAKIVNLLRENDKLEEELRLLTLQGDNLIKEGNNMAKQLEIATEELKIKKEEVKKVPTEICLLKAQAWHERASAYYTDKKTAIIESTAMTQILDVMTASYNTSINHDPTLEPAFSTNALNSLAGQAEASARNIVNTSTGC